MASFSLSMAGATWLGWIKFQTFQRGRIDRMKMNPQFFRNTDITDVPGLPRELVGYGEHPPRVRWNNGAKVAVQVVVNYEEGSEKTLAMGDQVNAGMYDLPF